MLLPIIDSFIKEVNNLAGDPTSPPFDEELSSCFLVMANETNPVNLGCKFFMLNISLSVLRKILAYLTILKLRSDSLLSHDGEPINQVVLTLALKGIIYAIEREEEPIDGNWETFNRRNDSRVTTTSSGDENNTMEKAISTCQPVVVSRVTTPSAGISTPGKSVRQSNSNRSSKNSTNDSPRTMTEIRPGTSKQSTTYRESPNRPESGASDESTPGKQLARGLLTSARGTTTPAGHHAGRRGRTSSISSTSSVSPLSILAPSPSSESRPETSQRSSPSSTLTVVRPPVIKYEPMVVNSGPSTSNVPTPLSSLSSLSSTLTSTSATNAPPSPDEPTFGLIVSFGASVSITLHEELIQVLDPYRDRIDTTPICSNIVFIKLKWKKDIYFLKRQIEILTRLMPRIVVTKFSRFTLDIPKQLAPTINQFVCLNVTILRGEYYVYSRISTSDENYTTIEILASSQCQESIESSQCLVKIDKQSSLRAIQIGPYQECSRCFFCYDDVHNECSQDNLMEMTEGFN